MGIPSRCASAVLWIVFNILIPGPGLPQQCDSATYFAAAIPCVSTSFGSIAPSVSPTSSKCVGQKSLSLVLHCQCVFTHFSIQCCNCAIHSGVCRAATGARRRTRNCVHAYEPGSAKTSKFSMSGFPSSDEDCTERTSIHTPSCSGVKSLSHADSWTQVAGRSRLHGRRLAILVRICAFSVRCRRDSQARSCHVRMANRGMCRQGCRHRLYFDHSL